MLGSRLHVAIDHDLSQEEAKSRLIGLITDLKKLHGDMIRDVQELWDGFTGRFLLKGVGFSVSLTLQVTPSKVSLEGKVPLHILPYKRIIEAAVKQRAQELLGATGSARSSTQGHNANC